MTKFTRRVLLSSIAASPLAMPGIVRAQSTSKPVKIGLLSDMGGPYRDVGGPGNRAAVELAVQDFGGSVLDRPIEIVQGDDQNKPDVAASLARQWIDDQGVDVLMDGAASSSGLAIQQIAREKKHIYLITGPASSGLHRQAVLAVRHPFRLRYVCAGARHRPRLDQGGREYVVLHHRRLCLRLCAGARHHRSRAGRRRQGAGQCPRTAGHAGFLQLPGAGEGVRRQGVRFRQCRHGFAELHQAGGGVRHLAERHPYGDAADGDQRRALAGTARPAKGWCTRIRSIGT